MLLSLNRRWDSHKHRARPRNPLREELLPSTALQLTPLFRQCKFTTTTLPTGQWSCKHAPHQRKKKYCILKYEFLQQGDSLREVGWNKPTRVQWSACLGKMMTNLHTQGSVAPLIQSSATDRVTWWLLDTHCKLCPEVLICKSCATSFDKNNYNKFAKFWKNRALKNFLKNKPSMQNWNCGLNRPCWKPSEAFRLQGVPKGWRQMGSKTTEVDRSVP